MTVFLDCRLLSKNPTGISRYTEQLIKFYSNHYNCSRLVLIINSKQYKVYDKVDYLITDLSPFRFIDCIKFSLLLRKQNLELLHSPFYSSVFFNKKFKKVVSVMDLMYKIIPNYFSSNSFLNYIKVKYFDLIVYLSLKNSSFLISISKSTEFDIKKYFNLNSITLKLGFTDLNIKNDDISIEINNLKSKEFYFYVGNNRKQKNLNFLIKCFLKSNSKKKLVIVGCTVKKNKNIINYSSVNESELAFLYKSCFCFVFPSLYEGFGIPIIEAISFSSRIILSNAGSLKEFSIFGLNYFDPKNQSQLINYFNNEHLISNGKNYHLMKEIFNWDNYFKYLKKHLTINNI